MNGVIVHYEKWELGALRDKIPRNNSTRNQLLNQIRSVDRTKKIVNYHIFKAQEAFDIDQLFTNNTNAADEIMRYLLGCGSNQEKFELDRIAIEANIIGAIFHTRSLWDHFAQLVNTLLLENDIDVHSVTIRGVLDRLNNSHQKCVTLKQELQHLIESCWYKYIESFSNTIKHRQLVEMDFNVSNRWDGFHFSSFTYRRSEFDNKNCKDVLDGVLEVCNHIINCGNHLNKAYGI